MTGPEVTFLVMIAMAGFACAALAAFGLLMFRDEWRWYRYALSGQGIVTGNRISEGDSSTWYHPLVRCRLPDGSWMEGAGGTGLSAPMEVGREVSLFWLRDLPGMIRVERRLSPGGLLFGLIAILMGIWSFYACADYFRWQADVVKVLSISLCIGWLVIALVFARMKRRYIRERGQQL